MQSKSKDWFLYDRGLLHERVKLTKYADPDKYGYGIGFDAPSLFRCRIVNEVKIVTIFGVDNNSSVHTHNRKKYILVLCEGPTDGLDDTAITIEAQYSLNITRSTKKICLQKFVFEKVYPTMQAAVFCMLMAWLKNLSIQSKNSEIKSHPLYLGNISRNFTDQKKMKL